jgi:hypothetical protein
MKETTLYFLNGIMIILSFFFIRILPIPYINYMIYQNYDYLLNECDIFVYFSVLLFPATISILNVYWFYLIINGLIQLLMKDKKNN